MQIERKDVHELKNYLAVGIGMLELAQKIIQREGKEADLQKVQERIEKSIFAQKKILDLLNSLKRDPSEESTASED